MILNTRHTGLVVRDIEQSIQFYQSIGLSVWRREIETGFFIDSVVGIDGVKVEWAKMKCPGGSILELLQYYSHPDVHPIANASSNQMGCSHVAFTVDDIAQTCEEVVRLGGAIVNQPVVAPNGLVKVVYCHDLDGILLELVEEIGSPSASE